MLLAVQVVPFGRGEEVGIVKFIDAALAVGLKVVIEALTVEECPHAFGLIVVVFQYVVDFSAFNALALVELQ